MSAKHLEVVGLGIVAGPGLADAAVVDALLAAFFDKLGTWPTKATWLAPRPTTKPLTRPRMQALIADPGISDVSFWGEPSSTSPRVDLHLRDREDAPDGERRWSSIVSLGRETLPAVLELAGGLVDQIPLVSGGIGLYPTRAYAEQEGRGGGVIGEVDPLTDARLGEDQLCWRRTRTKLRRLYPVTVIGPAIWATLPPMPAFDPMPRITDLGACKLLQHERDVRGEQGAV